MNDKICAAGCHNICFVINEDNQKTCQRQEINDFSVRHPKTGCQSNQFCEGCGNRADEGTAQNAEKKPCNCAFRGMEHVTRISFEFLHH